MEVPDRIYLSVRKGEDWAYAMWTQKTPEEQKFSELDEHEEYIRKDAILEWAKEGKEHYKKLMKDFPDLFAASFGAYNAFIEKLNSL